MSAVAAAPKLKLSYFEDNKGRNELTRLIFTVGGVPFDNESLSHAEYVERRDASELPYGQLPTLNVDGQPYGQSCAIARYAARIAGLYPSDPLEQLCSDGVVDAWRDSLDLFYETVFERVVINGTLSMFPRPASDRAAKLNGFVASELSAQLCRFDGLLSASSTQQTCPSLPFPSWADLAIYDLVKTMEGTLDPSVFSALIDDKAALTDMIARVDALPCIKAHLQRYPYKDIRFLFVPVPWWRAVAERILFPFLRWSISAASFARALVGAARRALTSERCLRSLSEQKKIASATA